VLSRGYERKGFKTLTLIIYTFFKQLMGMFDCLSSPGCAVIPVAIRNVILIIYFEMRGFLSGRMDQC